MFLLLLIFMPAYKCSCKANWTPWHWLKKMLDIKLIDCCNRNAKQYTLSELYWPPLNQSTSDIGCWKNSPFWLQNDSGFSFCLHIIPDGKWNSCKSWSETQKLPLVTLLPQETSPSWQRFNSELSIPSWWQGQFFLTQHTYLESLFKNSLFQHESTQKLKFVPLLPLQKDVSAVLKRKGNVRLWIQSSCQETKT